ncbi:unconventional myosin-VIIa-like [Pholidichthys leucotaenia]
MHPTSIEGVEDMIKLGDMTEAGLLRNLLLRHKQGLIYTYTGSVLVAVNPYQDFPIYSDNQVRLYHSQKLGELPPHIFAIAESCYFNMMRNRRSQCCIISGESGAGKTESTKLILQYLAAVSGQFSQQEIEKQILESNPILEAFGNAKTIRNDNSSRFGKYLEIFFNKDGVIEGARVEQYLLEKSRVCHQAPEERNYHIFYCILAGITAEEKKRLKLGNAKDFKFLTKGNCIVCDSRDDAKDYKRINAGMKILTFSESHCQEILKLLAAILHLGNVSFEGTTKDNLETSDVSQSEHFSMVASLLEVQKSSLATSLTHRSFMTNRERVIKPLSSEQASDCRDALVKAIYNKLFIWIVERINNIIYKKFTNNSKSAYLSIGLLDIFGFENFQTNSFEQLCINFANEKLQQFFVGHIFKLEQKEYAKEDIVWDNINFTDNQNILDLLAGIPCNVLALIDEESHFPKGSDSTMLNKMNQQHKRNGAYIASKSEHDTDFGIHHFAGDVYYDSNGFLEKNKDAISHDIIKMVDMSTNKLLHQIFEKELSNNGVKMANNKRVIMTPKSSLRAKTDSRKQVPTLSGQFRQSLESLMKALSVCQPYFIRCFKPNNDKQSKVFDRELCMRQLRYSGMMDTIRIRNLGYPIRHTFDEFVKRYRVLLKTTVCDPKTATAEACCKAICEAVIQGKGEWKFGRTKIFLKDAHDSVLERLREHELSRVALVIQRVMLGYKDRKSFLNKRRAVVVLQSHWRAFKAKREWRMIQHGFARLASKVRSRKLHRQYKRQRNAALVIQTQVRGYLARKEWKKKRKAVLVMQAHRRGAVARRQFQETRNTALLLQLARDEQDQVAMELKERLEEVARTQMMRMRTIEEPEPQAEEEVTVFSGPKLLITPASNATTPTPSLGGDNSEDEEDDEFESNDEFSFYRFSQLHFQNNANHTHVSQRLKRPLLRHEDEGDALACLTLSWLILRFMEDIPEPRSSDSVSTVSMNTITRNIPHRQGRRLSSLVGLDQKILRRNKKKLGGGRKTSTIFEEPENLTEDEDVLIGEGPTLDRQLTPLEKLHIIVGYAQSRKDIRDELYCQICKQLVNNRNWRSRNQGWVLLSICLGIFPPTDFFIKYLEHFVQTQKSPKGYNEYCAKRLRRILVNGERKELPCWIELQAARSKELIEAPVALMDGQTITVKLDSASTAAEVCQAVADHIDLTDMYGFSLYISFYDKMWSLDSCGKHVLDAMSQCEEEIRRQGGEEKNTPWRLSIRKELFTPWHDCSRDPVSTDLIYRQVIQGIKSGDYSGEKEDLYVQLAAKHYYIQFGSEESRDNVQRVVEECIATQLIESRSMTTWIELISTQLQDPSFNERKTKEKVKGELVDIAREKWPLEFSKFYEVTMMAGPPLAKSRFVVAVNWTGLFFMEGRDRRLLDIPYIEVKKAELRSESKQVNVSTVTGDYDLKSLDAVEMAALIQKNVEGLRERSVYALAQQDVNKPDDPMFMICKRGDLLLVHKDEEHSPDKRWIKATNQRTSEKGAVYRDTIEFLPTLSLPTEDILEKFNPRQNRISINNTPEEETVAPVSLKEFARENFRPASKDGGRQGRGASKEKLWLSSKEPIKQPLLKSLVRNSELNNLACSAFIAILKYMGDYPIKHVRSPVELTDQIFGPATQHKALRDEIYCQIMRQMTNNINRLSMERGWQLMYLCTGLFPPSDLLMRHAQRFLESRPRDPLSSFCVQRLQQISSKEPRNLPPHLAEVDAIQQNSTKIFHKVHFPNDTDDIYEVSSTTTIRELCVTIARELNLSSDEGYGLYMKTPTKMMSLEDDKYFFDGLRQTVEAPKKGKKVKEALQVNIPSLVIYKRKLWFNVTPGKDIKADLTFHFPQEMPKYLRGYHNCTKEDMINLGGLLFRTQVDSDRTQFVMIPKMLRDLVPADQIKLMSPEEWKKHIIASYTKQSGTTVQEAKIAFLRVISGWPNFGCSFFEVKQTCEPSYPSPVLIVVSKQGLSFVDPKKKELLVTHEFKRITEYTSKGNFFQMTISTLLNNTFVCETPQAQAIEDLLRSYVTMYENTLQVTRPSRGNRFR